MTWFRVDNRLVHGQIIEGWLPYLAAKDLVVINDALAEDVIQQEIMRLAIPCRVQVQFIPVSAARKAYDAKQAQGAAVLFLFATCQDVARMTAEQGIFVPLLNIGNLHYAQGKQQICPHVAVSEEDISCLRFLKDAGTQFDFRAVPGDDPVVEDW